MEVSHEYFEYERCVEEDYAKSEYHKKYYETYAKFRAQYCVNRDQAK